MAKPTPPMTAVPVRGQPGTIYVPGLKANVKLAPMTESSFDDEQDDLNALALHAEQLVQVTLLAAMIDERSPARLADWCRGIAIRIMKLVIATTQTEAPKNHTIFENRERVLAYLEGAETAPLLQTPSMRRTEGSAVEDFISTQCIRLEIMLREWPTRHTNGYEARLNRFVAVVLYGVRRFPAPLVYDFVLQQCGELTRKLSPGAQATATALLMLGRDERDAEMDRMLAILTSTAQGNAKQRRKMRRKRLKMLDK